jgi:hypothetical protein
VTSVTAWFFARMLVRAALRIGEMSFAWYVVQTLDLYYSGNSHYRVSITYRDN